MKNKPPIYFFEAEAWEAKHIAALAPKGWQLIFDKERLTPKRAAKFRDAAVISTFIYSDLGAKTLAALPNLRFVATRSTGFDHVDVAQAKKQKVVVSNVPTYGENTVAEHAFALILALSRKLTIAYDKVRKLDFDIHGLRGFDLAGKTIGIVGCGHIGTHLARMAHGFNMQVLVSDPQQDPKLAKQHHFTYTRTLDELLRKSDVVTLHAPYNTHTHHLINQKNIVKMKKGALLINTARGGLIETKALLMALDRKILGGVGLDVLEEECTIREERELLSKHLPKVCDPMVALQDHVLLQRPNVIVTPHIAFNSNEAVERIIKTSIENIQAFLAGTRRNRVV